MSLRNFRRSKVAPPPAKYDPEWVNQLRRALEESILKPDDFTNSYPFNSPYLSSGRIEVTQISNVTGGASNVTGTFTKSSPHDEESETDDSHHWVMRRWQSPTHSGLAYYASPARLPEAVTVGPNVSGFRLNYDNLRSWLDYDTAAAALSLSTKICFQAPIAYTIQTSSPTGRVDDEMLAEASSYWYLSLQDLATATLSQAKYQGITNNDTGIIVDPRNVLNVDSPLKAVDDLGNGWTDLKLAATAADKYLYSTAIDTWAEGAISAFGRSFLDDADATAGRNTLGALTGVWPATLGGTGQSSYTVGDLLYASTTTALSKLAAGTLGYVLTSGGAGVAPSWAAAAGGAIDGSGAATRVAYWSDADTLTSDADLVFNGTQLLVTGLFVGALTGTPARVLECRSTSAQLRLSYDTTYGADFAVSIAGHLSITTTAGSGGAINIGRSSAAGGTNTPVAIGVSASAGGSQSLALGVSSSAAGNSDVALGPGCVASAGFGVAIGYSADAITGGGGVAIGTSAQCAGANAISIGTSASAATASSIAIGNAAAVSSQIQAIAMGTSAAASGQNSIAIGASANASATGAIAIGNSATCATANTCVFGGSNNAIVDIYAGKGITHAAAAAWTLNGTGGSGTDIAGGALNLAGGKPTGSGVGGSVVIKTAPAGSSGTTLRSLVDRLTVDQKGNIYPGTAALATGATDGFLYIQTCAGTPTGVPTTVTGRIAIVYDTTNKKLYAYNGAWESVTFA